MSTKVKFGLTYSSENWTEGKIYFDNGGDANSHPLTERIYLNGKDYSGVKEITGENESSGYIVGSLKVDDVYIKVNGWDDKANKISNPINGNLVTMTADGDLVNSNKKPSDFDEAGAAAAVLGTVYGVRNAVDDLRDLSLKKNQLGTIVGLSTPIIGSLYGIAGLDSTGKIPSSQLPSYVDDVIEVKGGFKMPLSNSTPVEIYCPKINGQFNIHALDNGDYTYPAAHKVFFPDSGVLPDIYIDFTPSTSPQLMWHEDSEDNKVWVSETPEQGKIYVVTNLGNKTYRYTGSSFIEIIASPGTLDEIAEGSVNKHYTDAKANLKANKVVSSGSMAGHIATLKSDGDIDDSGKSFVTSFSSTVSNNNVPTEKLVKDALDLKAPLASPAFTGTPTSTTPSSSDDSTKIATTAYVLNNLNNKIRYTGSTDAGYNNIALFGPEGSYEIKDGGYSITTTIEASASNYKIPTEKAVNDKLADISSTLNNLVWD